ncbi:MAG: CaiB/BaiF CoA-transferase family protein [Kineosporiaceae bacterium]
MPDPDPGERTGPLAGLRVVELPGLAPVPFAAMMLADLGADVVRVDRPPHAPAGMETPLSGPVHRSRRRVVLDLKQVADVEALLELADAADVLVEGFRPGVAERLGFGPEVALARNPRLVYGRLTGWGQTGPLAGEVGHDITYLALSGVLATMGPVGGPPAVPVNYLADFAGGSMLLVTGVLAAVVERERSGLGQVVDAAMVDGAALLSSFVRGLRSVGMWPGAPGENLLDGGAPFYTTYRTADGGHLAVGAIEPPYYAALLDGLGLAGEDLPAQYDVGAWPRLHQRFAEVIATRSRDEWAQVFDGTAACVAPVLDLWEAHRHPHAVARQAYLELDGLIQPAPAPRFDRTPLDTPAPAPTSG